MNILTLSSVSEVFSEFSCDVSPDPGEEIFAAVLLHGLQEHHVAHGVALLEQHLWR